MLNTTDEPVELEIANRWLAESTFRPVLMPSRVSSISTVVGQRVSVYRRAVSTVKLAPTDESLRVIQHSSPKTTCDK